MPAAKSMQIRREIVQRRQAGESLLQIAQTLSVSYGMVRKLWRRFQQQGELTPAYERCRHPEVRKAPALYQQAIALKQQHPGWGAGLIRLELVEQFEAAALPSERTLQRWFQRAGVGSVRAVRKPKPLVQRGGHPHEVWAMDAKEQMRLADGSYASWLTITDEGSGAILAAVLFPRASLDADRPTGGQAGTASDDGAVGTPRTHPDG